MGVDDGHPRSREHERELLSTLASMIVHDLRVRDEVEELRADLDALPLEGPDADDFRVGIGQLIDDLHGFIAARALYLRALPAPGRLYDRIALEDPDCEIEAEHASLIAESAFASLSALSSQVRLLVELRRRA